MPSKLDRYLYLLMIVPSTGRGLFVTIREEIVRSHSHLFCLSTSLILVQSEEQTALMVARDMGVDELVAIFHEHGILLSVCVLFIPCHVRCA
jgi:hypothetical protein